VLCHLPFPLMGEGAGGGDLPLQGGNGPLPTLVSHQGEGDTPVTLDSTRTPFLPSACMLSKTMGENPVASKIRSNGPSCRAPSRTGRSAVDRYRAPTASMRSALRYGLRLRANVVTPRPRRRSASVARSPTGPGAQHRGALRPPDAQPALNLIGLGDALLDHRHRLQQHAHLSQALGHFDDVLGGVDVILRQIAVPQVDAALVLGVVGGHTVRADPVVEARARAAHGRHDVIPAPARLTPNRTGPNNSEQRRFPVSVPSYPSCTCVRQRLTQGPDRRP
jgi:hypothetical protein